MNAEQYRRLVENRRRRGPRPLGEPARQPGARSALAKVLAGAARALRLRQQAEQAWQRLVPPELCDQVVLEGVAGDELLVVATSPVAGFELRRRQARLERRLRELVPGLRRLRVVLPGGGPDRSGRSGAGDRS